MPIREWMGERLKSGMLVLESENEREIQGKKNILTKAILALLFTYDGIT